jgi:hypothetical protein
MQLLSLREEDDDILQSGIRAAIGWSDGLGQVAAAR